MFDLNADDGSVRKQPFKSPIPDDGPAPARKIAGNKLDSGPMVRLHSRLLSYYTHELDRQAENRRQMAMDEDFYDNIQWSDEDARTLEERGQIPLVFNVIATTIDWVLGTEKRSRTDFKVLPRRKEDGQPAQRKTELLKYLSDVNQTGFDVSRAFEDATKAGVGWLEDGWQGDDEDEPIYSEAERWRNMLWDSTAQKLSLEDARYIMRSKWVDLDIAKAMFPKRKKLLERSCDESLGWSHIDAYGDQAMDSSELENSGQGESGSFNDQVSGYQRRRLRIIEVWFRMPVQAKKIRGGMFAGEIFDEQSPGHQDAVASGDAEIVERPVMRMYVALMTTAGLLYLAPSPYRHNRYPFTPIWNKRRGRDGMPYGMIRNIRDLQVDINKRASKALHILSSNKVIMDDGAVEDLDTFAEELARPDAIIVKKQGYALTLNADRDLAAAHLDMMSRDIQMVQQVGGVTDENLGRSTNAVSGVAIQARQEQGSLSTSGLFDNLRLARQLQGEKQVSLLEQFMSEPKQFRITNSRGKPDYTSVNDGLPENDIVRSKADFVIDEQDWRASQRQAQVASLMDMLAKITPVAPQVALATLDLLIEEMDVPNRDELVKRIRQITQMRDPDEEGEDPNANAQAQAQAAQQQAQIEMAMAQLAKLKAEAEKAMAQAAEIKAKVPKTNIDAQRSAIEAANMVTAAPGTADVADMMLHEAGYVGRTEADQHARQQQAQAQQMQAQQPQAPQSQPTPDRPPQAVGLGM
jgi:hypothetical protein